MARRYEEEAGSFGFGSGGSRPQQGSSSQNDVAKDLQEISSMNRRFTSMISKIGGASDSASLRKQIHELQSLFTRNVKSAKATITQQVKSTDATVKLQGNRCLQSLQGEVSTFEESLKELRNKEQRFPPSKFASSTDGGGDFSFALDDDSGGGGGGGATSDRFAVAQQEELRSTEKRQEEHQALMNLEGDMQDLHSMFVDMAALVNDQGEVVNTIEDNVVSAEIKVEHASNDVRQAAMYQSKARRKKVCCLIVIGVAVVVIVIIVVVVVTTKKKKTT